MTRSVPHVDDTLVAGAGLCDPGVVDFMVREGKERVEEAIGWGRPGPGSERSACAWGEGGHSASRIVHADGDATGLSRRRCSLGPRWAR